MLESDCKTPEERDAFQARLPRSRDLNGAGLSIVPAYTEAGRFSEANCITVTDGERTAVYVAYSVGEEQSDGRLATNRPGPATASQFSAPPEAFSDRPPGV